MKTLNECLDHVLKTLVDNNDVIYLMCIEEGGNSYNITKEYNELYEPLGLSDAQFVELLQILEEKGYLNYEVLKASVTPASPFEQRVWFKNMATGKATSEDPLFQGYQFLLNAPNPLVHSGQCQKVQIKLRGKFYFEQGGFQGEENRKNAEKDRIQKQDDQIRLLTLLLAIGSIGVLIIEAIKFLLDYML